MRTSLSFRPGSAPYGDKTVEAVKKFKSDENLGDKTSGRVDRGVIMRLDELFPP